MRLNPPTECNADHGVYLTQVASKTFKMTLWKESH